MYFLRPNIKNLLFGFELKEVEKNILHITSNNLQSSILTSSNTGEKSTKHEHILEENYDNTLPLLSNDTLELDRPKRIVALLKDYNMVVD